MSNQWYSITSLNPTGGPPTINGYMRTTSSTIDRFYNITDTSFSNNLIGPIGGLTVSFFINDNQLIGGSFSYSGTYVTGGIANFGSTYNDCLLRRGSPSGPLTFYSTDGTNTQASTLIYTIIPISDPSCFNENTKILCLKNFGEEYIPIQNLRTGDLVKTYLHGYRKINLIGKGQMVNNPDSWHRCMYLLEKTEENKLIEDLIVTGGHALLVDKLSDEELLTYKEMNVFDNGDPIKIDDKYLLLAGVSTQFKKIKEIIPYIYYHLTLENNGDDDERFGIYANGILTETVSKNQFNDFSYELI